MDTEDLVFSAELSLPSWTRPLLERLPERMASREERLRLVVDWSRENFERDTGGPFAAAVFEVATGRLVSIGVNRVVPEQCSSAHAEVMALTLAQRRLQTFDLGAPSVGAHELVVNWRPCVMCFGAVVWSGVRSLVIAGSGDELEALTGFDEGPVPANWLEELARRNVTVDQDALKDEAVRVFADFERSGRQVYNPSRS